MTKTIETTEIPTAHIFGPGSGYRWNPVKGCDNKKCHLHPINSGKCFAAGICRRFAGPFAESEVNLWMEVAIHNLKNEKKRRENEIKKKFEEFKPTWLESQFQKRFPKNRASILVDYMTDIAYIYPQWVKKIIGRIKEDNKERKEAGLKPHVFQFLTKNPAVYSRFEWPENCWLGFTATNQGEFNERTLIIHDSLTTTTKEGISLLNALFYAYLEPLEENIGLNDNQEIFVKNWLKWIVVGGGPNPLNLEWVRSIRGQCQAASIPFYFKQWGEFYPIWDPIEKKYIYIKRRKKVNGNVLDGQKWELFPGVT